MRGATGQRGEMANLKAETERESAELARRKVNTVQLSRNVYIQHVIFLFILRALFSKIFTKPKHLSVITNFTCFSLFH